MCVNYITTMEITSEIINKQINQLENEKVFRDIEYKNRRAENNRRYYLKNREKLIKKHVEYNKHYEKHNENSNLCNRFNYYCKKGYFDNREEARKIKNYLINNNLSIKFIEFVKYWFELININYL